MSSKTVTHPYKVIIAATIRNNINYLPITFPKILEIRKLFSPESQIVVVENDSIDGTKEFLDRAQKIHQNIKIFHFDGLDKKIEKRTPRLAFCRNFIMNYIHTNFADFDYIILADMDIVLTQFKPENILDCFKVTESWDMLCSNSQPMYYDIWALRCNKMGMNYDCWDKIVHEMQQGFPRQICVQRNVRPWQIPIDPNGDLIPVESAFGGLAIYKLQATKNCKYVGLNSSCPLVGIFPDKDLVGRCNEECCEHVAFHRDMREKNNAKLFILPSLLVLAEGAHTGANITKRV